MKAGVVFFFPCFCDMDTISGLQMNYNEIGRDYLTNVYNSHTIVSSMFLLPWKHITPGKVFFFLTKNVDIFSYFSTKIYVVGTH